MAWNKKANTSAFSENFIANLVGTMQSIAVLLFIVLLSACGDDGGNNVSLQNDSEEFPKQDVSSVDELGTCDETNVSASFFVVTENVFYICDGARWQKTYFELSSSSNEILQIGDFDYDRLSSRLEYNSSSADFPLSSVVLARSSSSKVVKSSSSVRSSSSAKSSASVVEQGVNDSTCGDLWCSLIHDISFASYVGETEIKETVITLDNKDNGKLKVDVSFGYPKDHTNANTYAGIDFYYVRENDISEWGGICLVYQSTRNFAIELAVNDEEIVTGYDNYRAVVKSSPTMVAVDFPWSSFRQEGWGVHVDWKTALANVVDIRLKFEGQGTSGTYIIQSMGRLGTCNSSGVPRSSSSLKVESSSSFGSQLVDGILTDFRDGQKYGTVEIGKQTWMTRNLNYKSKNSYCYGNDSSNCPFYGRLYTWAAAVGKLESECGYEHTCSLPSGNIRGVCPSGWHLPSGSEWAILFYSVGGQITAGSALKSILWDQDGDGTNAFGFNAYPAGYKINNEYRGKGGNARFWSSTENDSFSANNMYLFYDHDDAYYGNFHKNSGLSVRCLKD